MSSLGSAVILEDGRTTPVCKFTALETKARLSISGAGLSRVDKYLQTEPSSDAEADADALQIGTEERIAATLHDLSDGAIDEETCGAAGRDILRQLLACVTPQQWAALREAQGLFAKRSV